MKRELKPKPALGRAGEAGPGGMAGERQNQAWRGLDQVRELRDGAGDAEADSPETPILSVSLPRTLPARDPLPSLLE